MAVSADDIATPDRNSLSHGYSGTESGPTTGAAATLTHPFADQPNSTNQKEAGL
jgi:hypothetical protein